MKKILLLSIIFIFQFTISVTKEPKLEEVLSGLNGPWSLSFIDENRILITEKSGNFFLADIKNKSLRLAKIEKIISQFEFDPLLKIKAKHLSGGQKKKLVISMALINDPSILLLNF